MTRGAAERKEIGRDVSNVGRIVNETEVISVSGGLKGWTEPCGFLKQPAAMDERQTVPVPGDNCPF